MKTSIAAVIGVACCLAVSGCAFAAPSATSETTAQSSAGLLLAQNGEAAQPIIIPAKSSDATKAVARELAEYLGRITGATFEIKEGDGSSGIVLGTLAQFPVAELKNPLEMRGPYDGVEAYAIRTEPKRVLLLGNTELGAAHATSRFLETLGMRWFFPGKNWEVVPSKNTLRYAVNESGRPVVLARSVWPGWGLV